MSYVRFSIILLAAGCTSKVEHFPRSDTPLGVGAHDTPPSDGPGNDTGGDTGAEGPSEDTGTDTGRDTGK